MYCIYNFWTEISGYIVSYMSWGIIQPLGGRTINIGHKINIVLLCRLIIRIYKKRSKRNQRGLTCSREHIHYTRTKYGNILKYRVNNWWLWIGSTINIHRGLSTFFCIKIGNLNVLFCFYCCLVILTFFSSGLTCSHETPHMLKISICDDKVTKAKRK